MKQLRQKKEKRTKAISCNPADCDDGQFIGQDGEGTEESPDASLASVKSLE